MSPFATFTQVPNASPVLVTAIHEGSEIRPELLPLMALTEQERRREEDPFTGDWAKMFSNHIIVNRSRFEVDINRAPEAAVYCTPEQAWGLQVWHDELSAEQVRRSLQGYNEFYCELAAYLDEMVHSWGRVLVLDLHSYNHRRGGPEGEPAAQAENPDINIGTGTMERGRWAPIIDCFIDAARDSNVAGHPLDVRENAKFRGGNFPAWIHKRYPESICVLSVEFKKTFMDEWSGALNQRHWADIGNLLCAASEQELPLLGTTK